MNATRYISLALGGALASTQAAGACAAMQPRCVNDGGVETALRTRSDDSVLVVDSDAVWPYASQARAMFVHCPSGEALTTDWEDNPEDGFGPGHRDLLNVLGRGLRTQKTISIADMQALLKDTDLTMAKGTLPTDHCACDLLTARPTTDHCAGFYKTDVSNKDRKRLTEEVFR